MRVLGRSLMVAIVLGGLLLAGYGIARERYPDLDEQSETVFAGLWEMGANTAEGLMWFVRTRAQDTITDAPVTGPESAEATDAEVPEAPVRVVEKEVTPAVSQVVRPEDPYEATRHDLLMLRDALAAKQAAGHDVLPAAQAVLELYLPRLMDAWVGTPYSYSGTTEVPGEGSIACGYYVSTVLEHAGFAVDRVGMARQASEQIARSIVRDDDIERFSYAKRTKVVKAVKAQGEGIFLVGLDTHAGFLVHRDGEVTFCHATRRGKIGVVCETAVSSPSMRSKYVVIGKIDDPYVVQSWLDGTPLVTAERDVAQDWPAPLEQAPIVTTETDEQAAIE